MEYSGGTHDFDDIVEGLGRGCTSVVAGTSGGVSSRKLWLYPKKSVLNVFLGGGELDQIMDMHKDVIEWAKTQGCAALTMSGRFGWKKPLEAHGWKAQHASYVKEFSNV